MNRRYHIFLLFILVAIITGCSMSDKSKTSRNVKQDVGTEININKTVKPAKKKIALVMKTLTNPFFTEMEKGARRAEEAINIELIVKTGAQETSIEQQINIIEELIQSKVDAIVIAPGSSVELIPVLKKAQDAKIPIINVDNRLDREMSEKVGLRTIPFVGVDNEQAAYLSAKEISKEVQAPAEAAIIEGIHNTDNSKQRTFGALRAFQENKNIKVVAVKTANWKIDEAYNTAAEILQTNPNLSVLFCANDMMALGASEYLQKVGRKDIKIAGFDNLEETREAIMHDKIQATIDQQADLQGYISVKYAYELLNHQTVPAQTIIPVKLIKKDVLK